MCNCKRHIRQKCETVKDTFAKCEILNDTLAKMCDCKRNNSQKCAIVNDRFAKNVSVWDSFAKNKKLYSKDRFDEKCAPVEDRFTKQYALTEDTFAENVSLWKKHQSEMYAREQKDKQTNKIWRKRALVAWKLHLAPQTTLHNYCCVLKLMESVQCSPSDLDRQNGNSQAGLINSSSFKAFLFFSFLKTF